MNIKLGGYSMARGVNEVIQIASHIATRKTQSCMQNFTSLSTKVSVLGFAA